MANKFSRLELGKIGLLQETEDGRIIQIGLRSEQSEQLQLFLGLLSQSNPLVQMGEDYELVLKSECVGNNTTHSVNPSFDDPKNWKEDYSHENGNCLNKCIKCDKYFYGYKRRFICKECFKLPY